MSDSVRAGAVAPLGGGKSVGATSAVPDVLAAGLEVVFCGINPGRVSAVARAHFANPRNDFWRLLHDAGFTPRLVDPSEQFSLLDHGIGVTNAVFRTTRGSGDLRAADFRGAADRLTRLAIELGPRAIAFVGKEAYRGSFGERPELGRQQRTLADTSLFVLPSTSPANAAVPYAERLHWFTALRQWLDRPPRERRAVRALVLDAAGRTLLLRWARPHGSSFWVTPGGAIEPGETEEEALRRELAEEVGLPDAAPGPLVLERDFVFPAGEKWIHQRERIHLLRVPADRICVPELVDENVHEHRWWSASDIAASDELFSPPELAELVSRASGW